MRTEKTIKEAERLMEKLRDDAEVIRIEADKTCDTIKALRMNEQVREVRGVEIGDFFRDESGHIGVFCGCWGKNMWGRLLDTRHYGYVYPLAKLTQDEVMTAIFKSAPSSSQEKG